MKLIITYKGKQTIPMSSFIHASKKEIDWQTLETHHLSNPINSLSSSPQVQVPGSQPLQVISSRQMLAFLFNHQSQTIVNLQGHPIATAKAPVLAVVLMIPMKPRFLNLFLHCPIIVLIEYAVIFRTKKA
jgi:hypothetical protein